jgi:multidrug resistance efflux pump
METRSSGNPSGSAPSGAGPQTNGKAAIPVPEAPAKRRGPSRALLLPIAVIVLAAVAYFGYQYWYNATHFVWTDNAQVSGSIIQVGALNAGQVTAVYTDVGQHVQQGEVVAKVSVPQTLGSTASGAPQVGFTNTANQIVNVTSPLSGVVVARNADPGSTVTPGQSIISVVDPAQLYVIANVNETDLGRIHVGQPVDVTVDSLNATLPGWVEAVTPVSAATFSLIPQQNTTGNFTKVVQVVPIKISVDYSSYPLVIGSSVEVNIHVQ